MSVATRTLLQICQEVARNLSAYESGTATAQAAATLTSAAYPYKTSRTNASTKTYEGDELYLTSGSAAPNPQEIASYAPTTGIFTVGIAWTAAPAGTETFDIYRRGLRLADIKQAVNRALRHARYLTTVPLTLVTDGDMETSGTASWGTAVNAAFTKVATAGNLFRGSQSGRVLNSSANGYLPSATIAVERSTTYYLEALVRAAVGTAELIAWDATNSAKIDSDTWADASKGRIHFTFTTPATCKSLTVRLAGQEASADCYWDNAILYRQGAFSMALPDYVALPGSVRHVYCRTAEDSDEEDQENLSEYHYWDILYDESNPLQRYYLKLWPSINRPLWLEVSRPFASLATDAATVAIDQDWIETKATAELLRMLVARAPSEQTKEWQSQLAEWSKRERQYDSWYMPMPIVRQGFGTPASVPTVSAI